MNESDLPEEHETTEVFPVQRRSSRVAWLLGTASLWTMGFVVWSLFFYFRDAPYLRGTYAFQEFWISRLLEWFFGTWVFIVGSCIASFLNVVAYRLPLGLPVTGVSYCPRCQSPILPADNVPVLGWLWLEGRCRACHNPISIRYPVFEAVGGLLLLSVYLTTVLSHGANLPLSRPSDLPYGLPVNLHFMEDDEFYLGFYHAGLLLILYAGALIRFSGGRLPGYVWIAGAIGMIAAVAVRPSLQLIPLSHEQMAFGEAYLGSSIQVRALLGSFWGASVAMIGAWLAFARFESGASDRPGLIAASGLIGWGLGWQAAVWILAFCWIDRWAIENWSEMKYRDFFRDPLRWLWLYTAILLAGWRWLMNLVTTWFQ